MRSSSYYNEIDPFCVAWLRNLIAAGLISPGDVDDRSIVDVQPDDLRGYDQCHFFAGIGGWSYALRLAGWPDARPVWTGSCPCQPFSVAGQQRGSNDGRHLWPAFFRLIRECRPNTVLGEQVAGSSGLAWLDHVCADLEDAGYAAAAANLCAAGVGAPHIRQRLYWMAKSELQQQPGAGPPSAIGWGPSSDVERRGTICCVADAECNGQQAKRKEIICATRGGQERDAPERPGSSPWSELEWLPCRDGKARPTKPGLFPLAHGVSGRVGRLRAYGNAIVPQVAQAFIESVMECIP